MIRRTLLAVALGASVLWPASQAEAAPAPRHCVVHVTGQKPSGELTVSAPRCYSTYAGAMAAETSRLTDFVLATHFDLPGFDPSAGSTSTVGSSCTGGWLNTSAAWNNRIGSTANGCPSVVHFDGANLTGANATTTGIGGNLGSMNNRTSSIQYT